MQRQGLWEISQHHYKHTKLPATIAARTAFYGALVGYAAALLVLGLAGFDWCATRWPPSESIRQRYEGKNAQGSSGKFHFSQSVLSRRFPFPDSKQGCKKAPLSLTEEQLEWAFMQFTIPLSIPETQIMMCWCSVLVLQSNLCIVGAIRFVEREKRRKQTTRVSCDWDD